MADRFRWFLAAWMILVSICLVLITARLERVADRIGEISYNSEAARMALEKSEQAWTQADRGADLAGVALKTSRHNEQRIDDGIEGIRKLGLTLAAWMETVDKRIHKLTEAVARMAIIMHDAAEPRQEMWRCSVSHEWSWRRRGSSRVRSASSCTLRPGPR